MSKLPEEVARPEVERSINSDGLPQTLRFVETTGKHPLAGVIFPGRFLPTTVAGGMIAERLLFRLLQLNAWILLLALPCALLPFAWMDAVHRDMLGLGDLANVPLTRYMARSLSLVYGMHGIVLLGVTLNWERYRPAVPYLAKLHIALGAAMLAVDLDAGLPWWWAVSEGPGLMSYGLLVLAVNRFASAGTTTSRIGPIQG